MRAARVSARLQRRRGAALAQHSCKLNGAAWPLQLQARVRIHVHWRADNTLPLSPLVVLYHAPTGQELDLKVVSVDVPRCRVALSLRQMSADPLRGTLDNLQWREPSVELPEVQQIISVLQLTSGIEAVALGRQAEEAHIVAQVRSLCGARQARARHCDPMQADWHGFHAQTIVMPVAAAATPQQQLPVIVHAALATATLLQWRLRSLPCTPLMPALLCPLPLLLHLQDVELYLTKASRAEGFTLVARVGRMLQELLVDTALSKDDMKKALTRVLSRVR